jgi:hypothetical protein
VERHARTFVPEEASTSTLATALTLLSALLLTFGLIAVFMVRNHDWTDSFMAALPFPGPRANLAADPALVPQLQLGELRAWDATLADQTHALITEASVTNDALVSVRRVLVTAEARVDGHTVASQTTACGKSVSGRLLRRIGRDELAALREIDPPGPVRPGQSMTCQVAFTGLAPGVKEVVVRIASVEPFPGHPARAFDLPE